MAAFLLIASVVIFACFAAGKVSGKLGIPSLLAFIVLGMLFGCDGIFKINFDNFDFAEQICSVALIFIMFYGGFGTNLKAAKSVALPAVLLSSAGVVITAGLVGAFCYFALKTSLAESFLIGSVISSTDAASVFSILRSKRLNLKYGTASMLELESGSNDPCAYMLTSIFIAIASGNANGGNIAYMIFAQSVYGIVFGIAIAFLAVWLMKKISFSADGFDIVLIVGIALIAYALPAMLGGNGYLSTYIVGIVLGGRKMHSKKSAVHFFDGVIGMLQMLIFFLLGLLAFPSHLPSVALPALLVAVFLTFVARPAAVCAILAPFKCPFKQQLIVSWAGLRGAASIVFAIVVRQAVETQSDIFHMTFFIVLFSILLQGSLIPLFSKKLGMIDNSVDVMKTFSDYSDETDIKFIRFAVPLGHEWCGKGLKEILLPPETLAVLIMRGGTRLVPDGNTQLLENDELILAAAGSEDLSGTALSEIYLEKGNKSIGKRLCDSEISKKAGSLVVMIKRGGKVVIPRGDTELFENDTLVVSAGD